MGGNICNFLDKNVDYIITSSNAPISFERKVPIVLQNWIEVLLDTIVYKDPTDFLISPSPQKAKAKKQILQSPKRAIKSMKCENAAEALRKQDGNTDINKYFEVRSPKATPEDIERRRKVQEIIEEEMSDTDSDSEPVIFLYSKPASEKKSIDKIIEAIHQNIQNNRVKTEFQHENYEIFDLDLLGTISSQRQQFNEEDVVIGYDCKSQYSELPLNTNEDPLIELVNKCL
ncbi:hypothetical protein GPJ56_003874 [Histomonas meleagridis]|uniref:uncharacterized protein n=1 Tax=Histomonas meleagridis TaxID=135588 RepID=UPI0035598B9C|nr:hypothetical protein GPJ56_003874 [Histomonas meleagridis]KAH0805333.1 hypothetical protein GO595_002278 [Histomonas meleagridis]